MRREFRDTYQATLQAFAQFILDNAPRGLTPRRKAECIFQIEEPNDLRETLYIEFERGVSMRGHSSASCDFSVGLKHNWSDRITDDMGNKWAKFNVECRVNWPSHGSTDPTTAMMRVELLRDVTLFAAEMQAAFSEDVYHLVATKEELDKEAAERVARELHTKVLGFVEKSPERKGMRAGHCVAITTPEGIPAGEHVVTLYMHLPESKRLTFKLSVAPGVQPAQLTRIA
jgi:hypothetical protein